MLGARKTHSLPGSDFLGVYFIAPIETLQNDYIFAAPTLEQILVDIKTTAGIDPAMNNTLKREHDEADTYTVTFLPLDIVRNSREAYSRALTLIESSQPFLYKSDYVNKLGSYLRQDRRELAEKGVVLVNLGLKSQTGFEHIRENTRKKLWLVKYDAAEAAKALKKLEGAQYNARGELVTGGLWYYPSGEKMKPVYAVLKKHMLTGKHKALEHWIDAAWWTSPYIRTSELHSWRNAVSHLQGAIHMLVKLRGAGILRRKDVCAAFAGLNGSAKGIVRAAALQRRDYTDEQWAQKESGGYYGTQCIKFMLFLKKHFNSPELTAQIRAHEKKLKIKLVAPGSAAARKQAEHGQ